MRTLIGALAIVFVLGAKSSTACEVKPFRVPFQPGMGTHIAYYCQANEAEKLEALEAVKTNPCVAKKLKEHVSKKGLVLSETVRDVRPYYFTKPDAQNSGPILDVRLLLNEEHDGARISRLSGVRVLVTGKKHAVYLPPMPNLPAQPTAYAISYELGEPLQFTSECPFSTCYDSFEDLCPKTQPRR